MRDLNDEINKLIREKGHWEDQIKFLGGTDYRKVGPKMLDHDGKEVPGNRGYKLVCYMIVVYKYVWQNSSQEIEKIVV